MSNFEVYDGFLDNEAGNYSHYYYHCTEAEVAHDSIRLFRRTANPNTPQVARAFRAASTLTPTIIRDLAYRAPLPIWSKHETTYFGEIMAMDENLDGCLTTPVDRLQAVNLACYDGLSTWLSTTHSPETAETLWPHMPLIELEVPLRHVMPITAVAEDTLTRLGKEIPVSQQETGVFGAIHDDWIKAIQ